ncbi:MAG: DeoR/GlpR family DNA-binding transcription regulator [Anaerolineales bacterium]
MLPAARRKQILELIETRNSISVAELCGILDVSDMTIRRDLRILSNEGLLERVHGGAVSRRGRSYEPAYRIRSVEQVKQKEIIGKRAASLIQDGDSVALDVGTTTLELAKALMGTSNLTVITASLPITTVLSEAPNVRLILTGGIVRKEEHSLIGHIAQRAYEEFHVDKAFIGVGGIHAEAGLTEYNLEDTLVKKAMIANAGEVIVIADSRKLGEICFAHIAPLSAVDVLVTEDGGSVDVIDSLISSGVNVIIA